MAKVREFAAMANGPTVTQEQRETWLRVTDARADAVRRLELETAKAQAAIATAKADAMVADDVVVQMVRSLGLDVSKSWRLDGLRIVEVQQDQGRGA